MNPKVPEGFSPSAARVARRMLEFGRRTPGIESRDLLWLDSGKEISIAFRASQVPNQASGEPFRKSKTFRELVTRISRLGFIEDEKFIPNPFKAQLKLGHVASDSVRVNVNVRKEGNAYGILEVYSITFYMEETELVIGISPVDRSPWVAVEKWIEQNVGRPRGRGVATRGKR